jgi:hypothetical protein
MPRPDRDRNLHAHSTSTGVLRLAAACAVTLGCVAGLERASNAEESPPPVAEAPAAPAEEAPAAPLTEARPGEAPQPAVQDEANPPSLVGAVPSPAVVGGAPATAVAVQALPLWLEHETGQLERPSPAEAALTRQSRRGSPQGWLEAGFDFGGANRRFEVPIDPLCDAEFRTSALFESSVYPSLAFRLSFFPGAIVSDRWPAGFGVEASFQHHLAIRVVNRRENQEVDSSQLAASVGALFRHTWGSADHGATLVTRLGWSRYDFFLGAVGNDIVPPVVYDAVQAGLSVQLPLWTRYAVLEFGAAYLRVLSVGDAMTEAYGAEGTVPKGHGYRLSVGLSGQIVRGLRWNASFEGLGVITRFEGKGAGFGTDPTTVCASGECTTTPGCVSEYGWSVIGGIATIDDARDSSWRVSIGLSYRPGWDPDR